ncbi:hypothetical protein ATEIFO6365_0005019600 [Aspergillus terreus]|uniref:Uncharacterized protein n=1 Tax=Aspergillus terreus TaxID=33178 RepID=A0A5M3Z0G9_ASPTE|nr:hypothetical protein ATETN484_0007020100 [Aspergillus terreus]GFF16006.1 hypothetical protein ATEIFO6365_0005019600 [Aspergillus terreus]
MSGFGKVMKEGWHPKSRDGGKESWRGDFKGINQVAGWMGKGRDKDSEKQEHVSAPLSSLKDPASFGPPPRHVKYHGPGALPNETTPDRRGLGAPLSQQQIHHQRLQQEQAELEAQRAQEELAQKPAPPPLPYRANRTGVDPSTLPPPPVRRINSTAESVTSANSPRPRPSIPPRMPARTDSIPSSHAPTPPPAYSPQPSQQPLEGYLNQNATSSLSRAGVSVPALGIGNGSSQNHSSGTPSTRSGYAGQPPVNELQTRFSQLRTNSSSPSQTPSPPARGDPSQQASSMSPSATQSASSAYHDFRERHGDKIDAGKQKISGLGSRIGSFIDDRRSAPSAHSPVSSGPTIPPHPSRTATTSSVGSETGGRKKAPPPPPPKRSDIRSTPVNNNTSSPAPPPVPLNTKPR